MRVRPFQYEGKNPSCAKCLIRLGGWLLAWMQTISIILRIGLEMGNYCVDCFFWDSGEEGGSLGWGLLSAMLG